MSTPDPRAELREKILERAQLEVSRANGTAYRVLEAAISVAGHEIERLRAELGTAREMRPPTDTWQVSVAIPKTLPQEMMDSLFTAVADAVHAWEPQDRDGWDVDVSGHPTVQPCPDARSHAAVSGVQQSPGDPQ